MKDAEAKGSKMSVDTDYPPCNSNSIQSVGSLEPVNSAPFKEFGVKPFSKGLKGA